VSDYTPDPSAGAPAPSWSSPQAAAPSASVQTTMHQMTEQLQTVIDAAERAAEAIRHDAEDQARRHLIEAQHKADQLTAERVRLISDLTDDLIAHASTVKQHSEQMVRALEEAITSVTTKLEQPAFKDPLGAGTPSYSTPEPSASFAPSIPSYSEPPAPPAPEPAPAMPPAPPVSSDPAATPEPSPSYEPPPPYEAPAYEPPAYEPPPYQPPAPPAAAPPSEPPAPLGQPAGPPPPQGPPLGAPPPAGPPAGFGEAPADEDEDDDGPSRVFRPGNYQ
jgi:hypothetical protein